MTKAALLAVCLAVGLAAAPTSNAQAQNAAPNALPLPTTEQQLQEQLKSFDPAAVAAARHYYESPKVRDGMLSVLNSLTPAIIANEEKQKGKPLSDVDRSKLLAALNKAMVSNYDYLIGLNMIAALGFLSKDELVALDNFYSSPIGQGILTKMPQLGRRLPGIMQVFMPRFIGSLQSEIKASGFGTP